MVMKMDEIFRHEPTLERFELPRLVSARDGISTKNRRAKERTSLLSILSLVLSQ